MVVTSPPGVPHSLILLYDVVGYIGGDQNCELKKIWGSFFSDFVLGV